jgi:hypothetical protein
MGQGFTYQGQLKDSAGNPINNKCDFSFILYDAETGGSQVGPIQEKNAANVVDGYFTVGLDFGSSAFEGEARWLAVSVGCPAGSGAFTPLSPRQALTPAPYAIFTSSAPWSGLSGIPAGFADGIDNDTLYTAGNGLILTNTQFSVDFAGSGSANTAARSDHTHWGQTWSGDGFGLIAASTNGNLFGALCGQTYGMGNGVTGEAIGSTSINAGVRGTSNSPSGYGGKFTNTSNGDALYAENNNGGIALHAMGNGAGNTNAALRAENTNGLAAYLTNSSGFPTLEIDKTNPGGAAIDLQLYNPGNTDPAMFIKAYDENTTLQFLVSSTGVVAANGYINWLADMAEMLPAVEELEAGDVLIIGTDGKLTLSTEPYQTSVAGVYSTDPGFIFGHPLEGDTPGTIPLAVVGVVPVKVSAENGPILPGDLLVSSSTPGYAMKAGANPPQGTVIGKALATLDEGVGVIQVLATLQ